MGQHKNSDHKARQAKYSDQVARTRANKERHKLAQEKKASKNAAK